MIELRGNELVFSFPEVHRAAKLRISLMRTLRIPDDGKAYPLPPGLGQLPIRHVDDFSDHVPESWMRQGGVMLPMYQSEALWIYFESDDVPDHDVEYPFAVQIATGKINAVNGEVWANKLIKNNQNYVVIPEQPWVDGYCVKKGLIRQFVAMPLGSGYTAEEQVTGKAKIGGMQILAYPMKRDVFEKRFPKITKKKGPFYDGAIRFSVAAAPDMGLAPGGLMIQEIYKDPYKKSDWDQKTNSRCFVHIANSLVWRSITGNEPPTVPYTAKEYTSAGLPWFDFYDDQAVGLKGAKELKRLQSVQQVARKKGDTPLPENESEAPNHIVQLRKRLKKGQVREV